MLLLSKGEIEIVWDAEGYLAGLEKFGIKPGLERVLRLLEMMGNPQRRLKTVHVAGTNGKGSTAVMTAEIIGAAGYRVGTYFSPHIDSYRERVAVKGIPISPEDLSSHTARIARLTADWSINDRPTEFEVLTSLAFEYFIEAGVDIAVVEVGMGGRFDATNVIPSSEVTVITSIGRDHVQHLGTTIEEIAAEKAGIIKRGDTVVFADSGPAVRRVLMTACREKSAKPMCVSENVRCSVGEIEKVNGSFLQRCSLKSRRFDTGELHLAMLGEHQVGNAASALLAAEMLVGKGYAIDSGHVKVGLGKAWCPARTEILHHDPLAVLDVGHNVQGILALRNLLRKMQIGRIILVTGMLDDKEQELVPEVWGELPAAVVITRPRSRRSGDWERMRSGFSRGARRVYTIEKIGQAVTKGWELAKATGDCLCISGSFYIAGEARRKLAELLAKEQG